MNENNYFWWIIFYLAVGTISIRFSVIALAKRVKITDRHKELFSYIPAAIIPALIGPMTFYHQGHVAWLQGKERLFILILSTLVCFYTRQMVITVVYGLSALYLITQF